MVLRGRPVILRSFMSCTLRFAAPRESSADTYVRSIPEATAFQELN